MNYNWRENQSQIWPPDLATSVRHRHTYTDVLIVIIQFLYISSSVQLSIFLCCSINSLFKVMLCKSYVISIYPDMRRRLCYNDVFFVCMYVLFSCLVYVCMFHSALSKCRNMHISYIYWYKEHKASNPRKTAFIK